MHTCHCPQPSVTLLAEFVLLPSQRGLHKSGCNVHPIAIPLDKTHSWGDFERYVCKKLNGAATPEVVRSHHMMDEKSDGGTHWQLVEMLVTWPKSYGSYTVYKDKSPERHEFEPEPDVTQRLRNVLSLMDERGSENYVSFKFKRVPKL